MTMFKDYRLAIFTKTPQLGRVKTRMQPRYSPQFSLALHRHLIEYCLRRWTNAAVCNIDVWITGDVSEEETVFLPWQHLCFQQQQGDDLGQRMAYAVKCTLASSKGIILVGTDCPFITEDYLVLACQNLCSVDVVIGPAADGGYVLLALKRDYPDLFTGIDWGESHVFEQTLAAIKQQHLSYFILPTLSDIDRPDDLSHIQALPFFSPLLQ